MGMKFFKINKYEPARSEKMLEEAAARGEFITRYEGDIAYFQKGAPRRLRYCIEPSSSSPDSAKRRLYEESGWRFVCYGGKVSVFCSEDENAVPLHTDSAEYAHLVAGFNSSTIKCIIFFMICMLIVGFPQLAIGLLRGRLVLMSARGEIGYPPLLLVSTLFCQIVCCISYISEAIKAARFISGNIESGRTAEKTVKINKLTAGLAVILMIAAFANGIFYCYNWLVSDKYKVGIEEVPSCAILADEVFPDGRFIELTEENLAYLTPGTGPKKALEDTAKYFKSAVTKEYYDYEQFGVYIPDGEEYGSFEHVHGQYIEFRSELLARRGVEDLINFERNTHSEELAVSEEELGSGFNNVCIMQGETARIVILRRGNTVWAVSTIAWDFTSEELAENITANIIDSFEKG